MRLSDVLINLGKPMAYYPNIGIACKSVNAGILVSQLGFWSDKGSHGDGWIYKSVEQLTEETGLSYKEQRVARRHLLKLRIIEEHYDRTNHRVFFRVDLERINEVWEEYVAKKESTCPKGTCPKVSCQLPKGKLPPAQRAVRTVPTKSTTESTQREPHVKTNVSFNDPITKFPVITKAVFNTLGKKFYERYQMGSVTATRKMELQKLVGMLAHEERTVEEIKLFKTNWPLYLNNPKATEPLPAQMLDKFDQVVSWKPRETGQESAADLAAISAKYPKGENHAQF